MLMIAPYNHDDDPKVAGPFLAASDEGNNYDFLLLDPRPLGAYSEFIPVSCEPLL